MRGERAGRTIGGIGVGCGLVALALTVCVALRVRSVLDGDESLARALHGHALAHPGWVTVNRLLSDWLWDPWTFRLLMAAVVVWLWTRGRRRPAAWCAGATVVAAGVGQGMKAAVDRDRPQWTHPVDSAHFAAFPSGHAMTATVVCGLLLWALPEVGRRAPWWAWTAAVVSVVGVGLTRLYLGVHWGTDVLAGWTLGVALVAAVALLGPEAPAPRAAGLARVRGGAARDAADAGARAARHR
ncbi:phosphatase PAP2 family protein [Streptomyces sp. BI20]|uniref:phosphatase PAP2 family protein n=1 Tax=Streptomyces sp. BI20 TaxID=3403460 RepID=UPI003C736BC6